MIRWAHKVGAGLYVLWGLLHLMASWKVYLLAEEVPTDLALAHGRLLQSAWNLAFLALFAIVVALTLNWKNDRVGYWLNLAVVSGTDIGFVVFILGPGLIPLFPGIAGPVLWILAALCTTIGYRLAASESSGRRSVY
ncbi:MAG: hypothetical protein ACE5NA_09200 [Nitrospiraceae bacterium]